MTRLIAARRSDDSCLRDIDGDYEEHAADPWPVSSGNKVINDPYRKSQAVAHAMESICR